MIFYIWTEKCETRNDSSWILSKQGINSWERYSPDDLKKQKRLFVEIRIKDFSATKRNCLFILFILGWAVKIVSTYLFLNRAYSLCDVETPFGAIIIRNEKILLIVRKRAVLGIFFLI